MHSSEELDNIVARFSQLLRDQGLHAALGFLNARTRHRFTGVYRFDPPLLRSVCLFDRENPLLRTAVDTLMRETYCSLVGASQSPMVISDSHLDSRVQRHPALHGVRAYQGVPLVDDGGACVGSLCHWDPRPRLVPEEEIPLLERVAPLVSRAATLARGSSADAHAEARPTPR